MLEEGVRKIKNKHEDIMFDGHAVPYAGSYIYGYCNFGSRNEQALTYDLEFNRYDSSRSIH